MRFYLKGFLVLAPLVAFICCSAQPYPNERLIPKKDATEDLRILQHILSTTHPSTYSFISKDSLDFYFENAISTLPDTLSECSLYLRAARLAKKIRCGHTGIYQSEKYIKSYEDSKVLKPFFQVKFIDNKILITKNETLDSSILAGSEILSINNHDAIQIIKDIKEIIGGDGLSEGMVTFRGAQFFQDWYCFLYGCSQTYSVSIKHPDGIITNHVTANKVKRQYPVVPNTGYFTFDTIARWKTLFLLKPHNQESTMVVSINSFYVDNSTKFYKSVFTYLQKHNISKFIVDLRGNQGGMIEQATDFLEYILKEKFTFAYRANTPIVEKKYMVNRLDNAMNRVMLSTFSKIRLSDSLDYNVQSGKPKKNYHFDGNIVVLTDGGTFSAGCFTAGMLKHHVNATIIGEETGGSEWGGNGAGWLLYSLPNSRLRLQFMYYTCRYGFDTKNINHGLLPDYSFSTTYDDVVKHQDSIWELAENELKKKDSK